MPKYKEIQAENLSGKHLGRTVKVNSIYTGEVKGSLERITLDNDNGIELILFKRKGGYDADYVVSYPDHTDTVRIYKEKEVG